MEINIGASINTLPLSRPNDSTPAELQNNRNEAGSAAVAPNAKTQGTEGINASTPSTLDTQSARPTEALQTSTVKSEEISERRRSDAPAVQLQNRIEDIVGGSETLNSQIDELV